MMPAPREWEVAGGSEVCSSSACRRHAGVCCHAEPRLAPEHLVVFVGDLSACYLGIVAGASRPYAARR